MVKFSSFGAAAAIVLLLGSAANAEGVYPKQSTETEGAPSYLVGGNGVFLQGEPSVRTGRSVAVGSTGGDGYDVAYRRAGQ